MPSHPSDLTPETDRNRASSLAAPDQNQGVIGAQFSKDLHEAIADAAAERMRSDRAREAVARILGTTTLGTAARWADDLRSNPPPSDQATRRFLDDPRNRGYSAWHFVNLPLEATGYDRDQYPTFTRDNDVVQMLLASVEALRNPGAGARFEEINALRWLTHLTGDLHQPIHVGCGFIGIPATDAAELVFDPVRAEEEALLSDRGGNQIKLPGAGSMHSFWDSALGSGTVPPETTHTAFDIGDVQSVVYSWATATLVEARKAYQGITITRYRPGTANLNAGDPGDYDVSWEGRPAYVARCSPVVTERMTAGASNMAALLDAIWPD